MSWQFNPMEGQQASTLCKQPSPSEIQACSFSDEIDKSLRGATMTHTPVTSLYSSIPTRVDTNTMDQRPAQIPCDVRDRFDNLLAAPDQDFLQNIFLNDSQQVNSNMATSSNQSGPSTFSMGSQSTSTSSSNVRLMDMAKASSELMNVATNISANASASSMLIDHLLPTEQHTSSPWTSCPTIAYPSAPSFGADFNHLNHIDSASFMNNHYLQSRPYNRNSHQYHQHHHHHHHHHQDRNQQQQQIALEPRIDNTITTKSSTTKPNDPNDSNNNNNNNNDSQIDTCKTLSDDLIDQLDSQPSNHLDVNDSFPKAMRNPSDINDSIDPSDKIVKDPIKLDNEYRAQNRHNQEARSYSSVLHSRHQQNIDTNSRLSMFAPANQMLNQFISDYQAPSSQPNRSQQRHGSQQPQQQMLISSTDLIGHKHLAAQFQPAVQVARNSLTVSQQQQQQQPFMHYQSFGLSAHDPRTQGTSPYRSSNVSNVLPIAPGGLASNFPRTSSSDDRLGAASVQNSNGSATVGTVGKRRGKLPLLTPNTTALTKDGQRQLVVDMYGTKLVTSEGGERYSMKVFVGGLPPDIDEEEIKASFRKFGSLVVDWPHKAESKSYFPPKGYAFLLFHDESSVQALINACFQEDDKLYLCVSSPTMKDKPVQIRPWRLSDADFVLDSTLALDPRKTVFVGGVPRPLKASELATIMNNLYGGVCYAGIDTDPELRYPKGAGRVAFSNHQSYIAAISARFVHLQHIDIDKRVEVKPYVLDDQICDACHGSRCAHKFAPFFCANITCLQYYCDYCWSSVHSQPGKGFHKPLVKEGTDRPRVISLNRWG